MPNVDERVVKMTFDNKDFETNAKKSTTTLGRLKDAIGDLASSTGSGLQGALSKLDFSDLLKIGGVTAGIHTLKSAFNSLKNDIDGVVSFIPDKISASLTKAFEQIKTGGWNRAMKIENAKFLLKGLGLDEDVFMRAADYAVSGTAYSLDAAASAAAQLGAAGITAEEDLNYMLRGISGFAAMTNRSFEEIAYHWTTMAGLGRITGGEITDLSAKGINVAAKLSEVLGKTEAEVKEMASKGQISFATFAKAMDDAFGEHAKDANDTFEGASANINAALSRIGEIFATPLIKNIVPTLNGIRIAINAVKTALADTSIGTDFGDMISSFSNVINKILTQLNESLNGSKIIYKVSDAVSNLFKSAKTLLDFIDEKLTNSGSVSNFIYGISVPVEGLISLVNKLRVILENTFDKSKVVQKVYEFSVIFRELFDSFALTEYDSFILVHPFEELLDLFKELFKTAKEVLGLDIGSFSKAGRKIVDTFTLLVSKLTLTRKASQYIVDIFRNLLTSIKNVATAAYNVADYLLPKLLNVFPIVLENALGIVSAISSAVEWVSNLATQSDIVKSLWTNIKSVIDTVFSIFEQANVSFSDIFFGEDKDTSLIDRISKFLDSIEDIVNETLSGLQLEEINFTPIKDFFLGLFRLEDDAGDIDSRFNFFDKLGELLDAFIGIVSNIFAPKEIKEMDPNAKSPIEMFLDYLKDFIGYIGSTFMGLDKEHLDTLISLAEIFKEVIIAIIWLFGIISVELAGLIAENTLTTSIKDGFKIIKETLEEIMNGFSLLNAKEVGTALGIGTAAKKTSSAIFKHGINLVDLIKAISWLMVAIAASLYIISEVSKNGDLSRGIGAFAAMLGILSGVLILMALAEGLINKFLPLASTKSYSLKGFKRSKAATIKANGIARIPAATEAQDFSGSLGGPWSSIAGAILAVALGMSALAVAMAVLNVAIPADQVGKFAKITLTMAGFLVIVDAAITAAVFFTNKLTDGVDPKTIALQIAAIGAAISAIVLSLSIMAMAIGALAILPNQNGVMVAGMVIGLLGVAITLIFGLVMSMVNTWQGAAAGLAMGAGIFLTLAGLSSAILAFATAMAVFSLIDPVKLEAARKTFNGLFILIGALALIMGAIMVVLSLPVFAQESWIPLLSIAAALFAFSTVVVAIGVAFIGLSVAMVAASVAGDMWMKSLEKFVSLIEELINFSKRLSPEELEATVTNLKGLGRATGEMVSEFVSGLTEGLSSNISTILSDIWTILFEIAKYVGLTLLPGALSLIPTLVGVAEIVGAVIPDGIGEAISGKVWSILTDVIIPWLDSKWGEFEGILSGIVEKVITFCIEELRKGKKYIEDVVDILIDWLDGFATALENNKQSITESMTSVVDTILDVIMAVVIGNKATLKLQDIGAQFVNGLAKGLTNFNSISVLDAAMDLLTGKGDKEMRKGWRISSPSKVAEEIGNYFIQGLCIGLSDESGLVADTINDLTGNKFDSLKNQIMNSFNNLGGDINPIITPELDLSSVKSGLGDMGNLFNDMTNFNAILSARSSIDALPNMQDLMNSVDSNYSNLIGTVYSIKPSQNPVPVNVNVSLEGDAKNMLKVMQKEDRRYTLAHGHSAFAN